MKEEDYVLDISLGPPYAFCPYNGGGVVLGLAIISDKCPGNLIGLWAESEEQANSFEVKYPNWRSAFRH